MFYRILDIFFVIFHSSLVLFNIFGWILKKTRIYNLITLGLTGASWIFLGMLVGTPGYCPLTDWHFGVLEKLGKTNLPNSYMKYLGDRITGLDINATLVDNITLYAFLAALILSVILNIRDLINKKKPFRKD